MAENEIKDSDLLCGRSINPNDGSTESRMARVVLNTLLPLVETLEKLPEPERHKVLLGELLIRAGAGLMNDSLGLINTASYIMVYASTLARAESEESETLQ